MGELLVSGRVSSPRWKKIGWLDFKQMPPEVSGSNNMIHDRWCKPSQILAINRPVGEVMFHSNGGGPTVDGWNPANQLLGSLSHYL